MTTVDRRLIELFPLPVRYRGEWLGESIYCRSSACGRCRRDCNDVEEVQDELTACPYGAHYIRLNDDLLIAGLVLTDSPVIPKAQSKLIKKDRGRGSTLPTSDALALIAALREKMHQHEDAFDSDRKAVLDEYVHSGQFREAALVELQSHIQDVAAGVHDLWNLAHQIVANCKAIFEKQRPGADPDEVAESMSNEGAIYFTGLQMIAKVEAILILQDPARMHTEQQTFRLHGLASKHAKIYRNRAAERNIDLFIGSGSYGLVSYSPEALSIVIQALIDNAVKYAPIGSKITLAFDEDDTSVELTVISLGPEIGHDERERIFLPSVRARAAEELGVDGMGFGLAAARLVCDETDLELSLDQGSEPVPGFPHHFETKFSLVATKTGVDTSAQATRATP